ncbi:two-component system, sporulation sensor kinase A [Litchfieldia salsa]|uniref:histidine kinase n=1 Tax=Litchfieldia salsa TaxID=930152 RepID=A0A1H0RRG9_9BACI|nr:two-component system, sporulation sensor kinase A [Litchfieldia salsa]
MNLSEIYTNNILERITDGFFAVDENWKFTYVNTIATKLLFRNQEDLVGENIWVQFPEAVDLIFYEQYHKAFAEQCSVSFDAFFPPLDRWFGVRAYPSPNGLSVLFQDITEKKRENSKKDQHYLSLFEHHPDAVFSFNLDGFYQSVNKGMEELLGYKSEEYLNISYKPLVNEKNVEEVTEKFNRSVLGEIQHYETQAQHKNGQLIDVSVTNIPIIVDGKVVGVYGIAKDITKEKIQDQLLIQSEKLSAVGQLSASIAHEIRNPLTSLKGFLQLMEPLLKEIEASYFDIMVDEINRIEKITGELLLLAKPQAVKKYTENIIDIIEDVVNLLQPQALMNHIQIEVSTSTLPMIICDRNQLKQAFINLIKNSIESMGDGGVIQIDLMKLNEESIHIQIVDQGCGISEDLLNRIGLPFYTTKDKGTGLGMMTTIKIIEHHKGSIKLASEVGEGTIIDIILPTLKGHALVDG